MRIPPEKDFDLEPVVPNPLHGHGEARLFLHKPAYVRISLYDLQGRLVRTLLEASLSPGTRTVSVDASDLSSGVYLLRATFETGRHTAASTRRITILH